MKRYIIFAVYERESNVQLVQESAAEETIVQVK